MQDIIWTNMPYGIAALFTNIITLMAMMVLWQDHGEFPYKQSVGLIAGNFIILLIMYLIQNL